MRTVFFNTLKEYMRKDQNLFLLVADMGLGLLEGFQEEFPQRAINVGIAEQNMVGIAAGLCNLGFRPFCYTISNFLIQRCFEQIRNDVCLHKYPVTLVGTSTGFDNGLLGATHQVVDDIGCLKALPNIAIYSPGTCDAIAPIFSDILANAKPAYLRIGKSGVNFNSSNGDIDFWVSQRPIADTLLITHGSMLKNCMNAALKIETVDVYCVNKIKPLDGLVKNVFDPKYQCIIVVEDHFGSSGLYNSICQFFVESGMPPKNLYSLSPAENYEQTVGDSEYFADKYGYSTDKIVSLIQSKCRKKI